MMQCCMIYRPVFSYVINLKFNLFNLLGRNWFVKYLNKNTNVTIKNIEINYKKLGKD